MNDTQLIQMLTDVVEDFLPNIGNCALQDYGRLNDAMIASKKRLGPTPTTPTTMTFELAYDAYHYHHVEIEAMDIEEAEKVGLEMADADIIESFGGEIESPCDAYFLAEINWVDINGETQCREFKKYKS